MCSIRGRSVEEGKRRKRYGFVDFVNLQPIISMKKKVMLGYQYLYYWEAWNVL